MVYQKIIRELKKTADPMRVSHCQRFFKTGPGEYGEGDIFIGLRVPDIRKVIGKYFKEADFEDVQKLLDSKIHEYRLAGVFILIWQYQATQAVKEKELIFKFYLKNIKRINNWDLVDISAHKIVGDFLLTEKGGEYSLLIKMAGSKDMWERRIAMVATARFIADFDFRPVIKISEMLLGDKEDLLHKATGWMLREMGKRDKELLVDFLEKNIHQMPRTCLRYAIEKFPEKERQYFLKK